MKRSTQFAFGVGVVVVVALLIGGAVYYYKTRDALPSRALIADKPELQTDYDNARAAQAKIIANPKDPLGYISEALELKSIGDATQDMRWYRAAITVYEQGINATNHQNTLLITNAAVLNERIGNYDQAKKYYEQAIELSPGDTTFYLSLIHLLRNHFNATPQEIFAIYNKGVERIVGGAQLYADRAEYLKSIGRYDDALADYTLLHNASVISDKAYQAQVDEITKLKQTNKTQ